MKWKIGAVITLAIFFSNYAYAKYTPSGQTPLTKRVDSIVHTIDANILQKKQQQKQVSQTTESSKILSQSHENAPIQNQHTVGQNNILNQPANHLNQSVLLHVAAQSQNPELYNGCEMTSLSMLLDAAGQSVDKMTLANEIPKDPTPEVLDSDGSIASWGDPNIGFVGDITGNHVGYGVYHSPVFKLLDQILPGKAIDLTGRSFEQILNQVASGKPVIAWTTVNFAPTSSWVTWQGPKGPVHATLNEHVVLIVGFNNDQIFVNDPLDGTAAKAVNRAQFESSWEQLGQQAVSFN
jgi:uncharacterized protein YvpB